ncbi:MAG TPA: pyridoxamine 5'-phosphate oxidase [Thermoanaerobaculia bacterium]|nr:pyridoxamine 5'-phosphate oxidase [Thermoanaerobaculia bacterium]
MSDKPIHDYGNEALHRRDLHPDPIEQFRKWFGEAVETISHLPEAMTLATADERGRPSARLLLLKGVDGAGFTFFTNYDSRKAVELSANPYAALVFWWPPLEKQVRIEGAVQLVSEEESDLYFATRPRGSQLGAWASNQSGTISEDVLEKQLAEAELRYQDRPVPRPPHWGGFRLIPEMIEFWQGRPNRLHDRFRYRREDGNWIIERLAP